MASPIVSVVERDWVVGIDGSDHAIAALRWAAVHAPGRTERIVVLGAFHVPVPLSLLVAKRGLDVDRLGIQATTGHDVDVAIEAVGDVEDVELVPRIVEGSAPTALIEASSDASMLVLGQRGAGEDHHTVLGSVSRYCSTHAGVPTVVVPPDWSGTECAKVVVGFDGSDNATRAARWAADFAPRTAELDVITAVEVTPWLEDELVRSRFPEEVDRETARLTAELHAVSLDERVTHHVVLQDAREALLDAAGEADLVVVGARGHGPIAAALLGSVASWMLHHPPCPVAVVPHSAD
jgi:nucleotide-binding universal stress UspA family protein